VSLNICIYFCSAIQYFLLIKGNTRSRFLMIKLHYKHLILNLGKISKSLMCFLNLGKISKSLMCFQLKKSESCFVNQVLNPCFL
jgi:hypothetical protein